MLAMSGKFRLLTTKSFGVVSLSRASYDGVQLTSPKAVREEADPRQSRENLS